MRRSVDVLLKQHGMELTLTSGGASQTVRGLFQAVGSTSWQSMVGQATPLGEAPQGQYLYIGPADVEVREGDTLTVGGKMYLMCRAEGYLYNGQPIYWWGLCVERREQPWGSGD